MRDADLELAVAAARGAGEIVRRLFRSGMEVDYKSADQPVTEADRAADRFLRGELLGARPEYGWVSEESQSVELAAERIWVVDPLDGTWNFIQGRPEFAVCVGLLERGTPALGVVYNPVSGVLYHATRGGGAFRNGEAIHARAYGGDPAPRLVASIDELDRGRLDGFRASATIETLGSTALKVARVAEGGADLYVSGSRKGLWDVCAAAIIAAEAGARVLDPTGAPIDFSLASMLLDGLIVIGPGGDDDLDRIGGHLRAGSSPPEEEDPA